MSGIGTWFGRPIKDIQSKTRPLAIEIENNSSETMRFNSAKFESGNWFSSADPEIKPGQSSVLLLSNRDGFPEGVIGSLKYVGDTKQMIVAFDNPLMGKVGMMTNVVPISESNYHIRGLYQHNGDS